MKRQLNTINSKGWRTLNSPLSRILLERQINAGRMFARDGIFKPVSSPILISMRLAETSSASELTPRLFETQKADGALSMIIQHATVLKFKAKGTSPKFLQF